MVTSSKKLPSRLIKLYEYTKAIKNIFFPPLCLGCGKKNLSEFLCQDCRKKIIYLYPPLCPYCSGVLGTEITNSCKKCRSKPHPYHKIISITAYRDPMVNLIHLFKYKNYDYLVKLFSSLMTAHLSKIGFRASGYHFMTSVPMHSHKLKMRDYNHAEVLGRRLSNFLKIPFRNDIIYDISIKPSQTKLLRYKREENVKGAFVVKEKIDGKKIILIDDIFTTGATVKSCSQALKENGADTITVITLSKA